MKPLMAVALALLFAGCDAKMVAPVVAPGGAAATEPAEPARPSPAGAAASATPTREPVATTAAGLPAMGATGVGQIHSDDLSTCPVTIPDPPFVPPKGFVARPPAYYGAAWYGNAHLWTMLDKRGERWHDLPVDADGYGQKTFWWSADWPVWDELEPAIRVTGRRLDGNAPPLTAFFPGTNASADFGTAMLVGVDVPTAGCWELTARYRAASLSVVVWVAGD
jgi:hypothetical protein